MTPAAIAGETFSTTTYVVAISLGAIFLARSVRSPERVQAGHDWHRGVPSPRKNRKMKQVSRYHPLLVTLHWVLAVMIIAALTIGFFVLADAQRRPSEDWRSAHTHGRQMLILVLMVIRFIVRCGHRVRQVRRQVIPSWIGSRRSPITAFTSWSS